MEVAPLWERELGAVLKGTLLQFRFVVPFLQANSPSPLIYFEFITLSVIHSKTVS